MAVAVRRTVRVSLDVLLMWATEPSDQPRYVTVVKDAIPDDAVIVSWQSVPGTPDAIAVIVESASWSADLDGTDFCPTFVRLDT
jgi:hypothetical protein